MPISCHFYGPISHDQKGVFFQSSLILKMYSLHDLHILLRNIASAQNGLQLHMSERPTRALASLATQILSTRCRLMLQMLQTAFSQL